MLVPRYFFTNDFHCFYEYFVSNSHKKKKLETNEYLWKPGEPFSKIYYIISGVGETYVEHENGYKKILSFHGAGTLFPVYHKQNYKIEQAIITKAITNMEVLEFSINEFQSMYKENIELNEKIVDWYSMYVNLLIYETAHQEYNSTFVKLCNLLYLLSQNNMEKENCTIHLTQEDIADILAINRVNLSKNLARLKSEGIISTHRKWIEIKDIKALKEYCSNETI